MEKYIESSLTVCIRNKVVHKVAIHDRNVTKIGPCIKSLNSFKTLVRDSTTSQIKMATKQSNFKKIVIPMNLSMHHNDLL